MTKICERCEKQMDFLPVYAAICTKGMHHFHLACVGTALSGKNIPNCIKRICPGKITHVNGVLREDFIRAVEAKCSATHGPPIINEIEDLEGFLPQGETLYIV